MNQNTSYPSLIDRLKAACRNRQTWGFIVSVAIMAIISLAFFYPDNIEGNDLRQHDMLQGVANGQEVKAYFEATGHESRWTNSLFSGMPTFQIAPSYPSNSLFSWITRVYGLWLPAPSNLLFMMMLGFMILLISMKIRWEYSLIGAIAWGFSSYFVIIIGAGHIWKFVTLAYIPPTIAGVMLAYRGRYVAGAALTALFTMMQLSANHVQMTYYFGFVIVGVTIACLITSIKKHRADRWIKATVVLIVAGALGVAANMPNLYHTWKYAKETQREASELALTTADSQTTPDRSYNTSYSYGRSETFTLAIPNVKGGASAKPYKGRMTAVTLADLDEAGQFDNDPYVSYYLNFVEQYFGEPESTNGPVYVGVIIVALFLLGCIIVRGPLKWALVVLTLLSILLAWGRNFMPLSEMFIDYVPLYSKFRTPESILVIAEFTMPMLAIMAMAQLLANKESLRHNYMAVAIAFGAVGAVCLVGAIAPKAFGPGVDMQREVYTSQQVCASLEAQGYGPEVTDMVNIYNPAIYNAVEELHLSMVRADSLRSLLLLALAFGLLTASRYSRLKTVVAGCGIGVFVLIDLYSVDKRYINHDSFSDNRSLKPSEITMTEIDRLILQDTDPSYRVMDFDRFGMADPSYFHKMIGGYHAAKLHRYQDLIDNGMLSNINVLDMLNARYIVYRGQVEKNPYALGNAWFVDSIGYVDSPAEELASLDQLDTHREAVADTRFKAILGDAKPLQSGDTIFPTSYAPDRLSYRYNASDDVVALFSEIYFPWGWQATVDGREAEIARANYVLRAMRLPAGSHEIVMTFAPESVATTQTVATVAVILIYLICLAAIARALSKAKVDQPAGNK